MTNTFKTNVAHFETETGDKILYPFGPPIFQTEIDSNFTEELIEEGRKLNIQDDDWSPKLAGNLKYGRSYHYKKDYILKVEPYLKKYVEKFFNGMYSRFGSNNKMIKNLLSVQYDRGQSKQGNVKLDTLWINFSQKHDFNPPHRHLGILSFVIYCKVPMKIFEVQADSNFQEAGNITFSFGEETTKLMSSDYVSQPYKNLMFLFPAELKHFVSPYWVDAERISVSGNFIVV